MLDHAPRLDTDAAARLARDLYGLDVAASALPSERDQNFLLDDGAGAHYVLKIANALEDPALLDAQQRAMTHLASSPPPTISPRVVPSRTGAAVSDVTAPDGRRHAVWAVTCLPGVPLGTVRHRSPALLADFGAQIGTLSHGLADFDHPAIHREFYWDLACGRRLVGDYRPLVDDPSLGAAIDALIESFDRETAPLLHLLRRSAIHNDLNDYNVLVSETDGDHRVAGFVDFGDMVYGYTIGDLAIAAAYVVLDQDDPLAAAAHLVRGYHARFPLRDPEIAALFGLITLRLCTSACVAAHQRRQRPDNAYLDISQAAIRRTLPALARIPPRLPSYVFRDACALDPLPASTAVQSWLRAHSAELAPVLPVDLRTAACTVLDLSVGSPLVGGDPLDNTEPKVTRRIRDVLQDAGTTIGIGRYDEPRLLYSAPSFALQSARRTIHLGLDLFADAGTPIHAPLAGTVHAFADNARPQDYGPVLILRHETDDGTPFFTIYGHLSRASIAGLQAGQPVARGQRIATLGTPHVNGGWTPHLHLQLVVDLLDLDGEFPGVASASQRAVWRALSPDPNLLVGVPARRFPPSTPTRSETLAARQQRLGHNLSVAYHDPLRIVRGWRQHLYDDEGRRYLDAYNNVPHVGHCHPRVVEAGQRQMAVLNTNTRYLNDRLIEYAARLTATLPSPLSVCFFLNSASEANELALRLARAYTGRRDMIVLAAAYHGNTTALIDLSPYKHDGPGGRGAPDWVHVAPLPDDYRGPFKRDDPDAGRKYARQVADLIARVPPVAGFIAETCPSVGGQIMLPPGYLADVYGAVRTAGGVCIADEVQTGLGRIGTHFWAFQAHGVVPDIVVMGKPLGNGHPMAALVTTPAIADAFDNGMEFFSTFGGNTVSSAVGLAVLDVLRDESLQAHALRVGNRLLAGLRPLARQFAAVGDVRGSGLFLGLELVRDRVTMEPAPDEASRVVNRMREQGILLGTDGPYHNVVKIRPPMPFDEADADYLVETFARII